MIGTTVSRHRTLARLGGLGTSVVYEAEDLDQRAKGALRFTPSPNRRILMRCVPPVARVTLLGALFIVPLFAEAPQATGKFSGKNWEFTTSGAYAYPGKVGSEDEIGVRVAVSNAGFKAEYIDRFWFRDYIIDHRFADEKTLVVYFHFSNSGAYEGMSYSFGPGDGCGLCYDSTVVSSVKIAGGRLKGRITRTPKPDENAWDIALDVPVAKSDYGSPLPADGGEVGAVYAAYHKALGEGDWVTLGTLFPEEIAANIAEEKEKFVAAWREDHPTKSYHVVKGFSRGDQALLVIEGENSLSKVDVEAHFVKAGGAWKINDEFLQVRYGEE